MMSSTARDHFGTFAFSRVIRVGQPMSRLMRNLSGIQIRIFTGNVTLDLMNHFSSPSRLTSPLNPSMRPESQHFLLGLFAPTTGVRRLLEDPDHGILLAFP